MSLSSSTGTGKLTKLIFVTMLFLAFIALVLMDVRGVMTTGPGVQDAATVNGERITTREVGRSLDEAAQRMGLTPAAAAQAGLPQYIVQGLVSEKLSRQGVDTLGLRFSDKQVAEELRAMLVDPKDPSADALKLRYEAARRASGLSQKQFEDEIRAGIARRLVLESLKSNLLPDPLLANVQANRTAERRNISVITLSTDPAAIKDTPEESEIEAMYSENQKAFTDAESRTGRLYILPAATLKEKGKDDPQAYVMEIEDAFAGGDEIDNVVKTYDLQTGDALKNVTLDANKTPLADALFSLDTGGVSNAVEMPNGDIAFVALDDVTPEKTRPLVEVRDDIVALWRRNEAVDRARALEAELRDAKDPLAFAKEKSLTVSSQSGVSLKDELYAPVFDAPVGQLVELKQDEKQIRLALATSVTPGTQKWSAKSATMAELQEAQNGNVLSNFYQMLVAWTKGVNVKINDKAIAALSQPAAATPVQ